MGHIIVEPSWNFRFLGAYGKFGILDFFFPHDFILDGQIVDESNFLSLLSQLRNFGICR